MKRSWSARRATIGTLTSLLFLVTAGAAAAGAPGLPSAPPAPPGSSPAWAAARAACLPRTGPLLNQLYQQYTGLVPQRHLLAAGSALLDGPDHARIVAHSLPGRLADLRAGIERAGGWVSSVHDPLIFARLPIAALPEVASLDGLRLVRAPAASRCQATSEGVAAQGAGDFHDGWFRGRDVKAGVIDCGGFAGYEALLGTDLPAGTALWTGGSGDPVGSDMHGTACAEIVVDMAPAVDLYCAHDDTEEDFYGAVAWMLLEGVQVISHSCCWLGAFPLDGAGLPHNPINETISQVRAAGALWVNSAGNYADANYQAVYNDTGSGWHYFGPEYNMYVPVLFEAGDENYLALTWNDWPADPATEGASQDYDLFLWNYTGGNLIELAQSLDVQDGSPGDLPFEAVSYTSPEDVWFLAGIRRNSGPDGAYLSLKTFTKLSYYWNVEHSIAVPADCPDAVSVGAVHWNGFGLEPFSSQGPTLGPGGAASGGAMKPDLAAADAVSTESYGPSDGESWEDSGEGFFGTSASAPHVAGAAAVLRGRYPAAGPGEIEAMLTGSAVDMGVSGPDDVYGHGRLHLDYATPDFGVRIDMPARARVGRPFAVTGLLDNPGAARNGVPTFFILGVYGQFWFWPDWSWYAPPASEEVSFRLSDVATGTGAVEVIPEFVWPDTGSDSVDGLWFYGAFLNAGATAIDGEWAAVEWGYGP